MTTLIQALAALLAFSPAAHAAPSAEFDQGMSAHRALESVRRSVREDRAPLAARQVVAEPEFRFSTGNDFKAVMIYGEISVTCNDQGQNDHAYFRCREELLDPAEFVHFTGPNGIDADQVTLTATWEGGRVREKTKGWNAAEGRSTDRFNLWIATLLQRPLLDYGKNTVLYSLKKDGKTVREGGFTAAVTKGEPRSCRYRRHYFSNNISDCRAGTTRLCDRYFRDENYCR